MEPAAAEEEELEAAPELLQKPPMRLQRTSEPGVSVQFFEIDVSLFFHSCLASSPDMELLPFNAESGAFLFK
jgi:hypothetical protein